MPRQGLENVVPEKDKHNIRYITFNVNGVGSLFNYYPWNKIPKRYDEMFSVLGGDIVSLQEIKTQGLGLVPLATLTQYRSFILVPRDKKGYSGVGLFIRIPQNLEPNWVKCSLTPVLAEEGVTGRLKDNKGQPYHTKEDNIGGYLSAEDLVELGIDSGQLESIDNQGRCVIVELASNTVVFSLYCPANSMATEEGSIYRLTFLKVLFKRCANITRMGKHVCLLGDFNVCLDLIDHAQELKDAIKAGSAFNNLKDGGFAFEKRNRQACLDFKTLAPHRTLINKFVHPTSGAPSLPSHFLHDTTRVTQKRRLAMYTVWNTLTSSREINFGSRIDFILTSDDTAKVVKADILPYIMGSDHCPVFTDFDCSGVEAEAVTKKLPFEAKTHYKLAIHRDITSMFSKSTKVETKRTEPDSTAVAYVSRKKTDSQRSIKHFFPTHE